MTAILTTACVLAILAAVCAAHRADEMNQVSACRVPRRVVIAGQRAARVPRSKVIIFRLGGDHPTSSCVQLPNGPHTHTPLMRRPTGRPAIPNTHTDLTIARTSSLAPLASPLLPVPELRARGVSTRPLVPVLGNHLDHLHRVPHGRTLRGREDEEPGPGTPRRNRPRPR